MTEIASLRAEAAACRRCPLWRSRTRTVWGSGPAGARLMAVGEAPGASEDEAGVPFVGPSGQLLRALLGHQGAYLANAVLCRPPGNRPPTEAEVAACAPYLDAQVAAVRPAVIVALGATAARALVGWAGTVEAGRAAALARDGVPVVVTLHPAEAARSLDGRRELAADLQGAARRAGAAVTKAARSPITVEGFLRHVRALALKTRSATSPTVRAQVGLAVKQFLNVNYADASEDEIRALLAGVNGTLRAVWDRLPRTAADRLTSAFDVSFATVSGGTRRAARAAFHLPVSAEMSYVDRAAAAHLVRNQSFYIRDEYGRVADRASAYARRIVGADLEAGLGNAAIARDLGGRLGVMYGAHQANYYETVASVFVNRSRSWSQASTYRDAHVAQFRIKAVMDEATTEICISLNDRIIAVDAAYDLARSGMTLADPTDIQFHSPFLTSRKDQVGYKDREGDFVTVSRRAGDEWRSVVPDDRMVEHGIGLPPYHFRCRTDVEAV